MISTLLISLISSPLLLILHPRTQSLFRLTSAPHAALTTPVSRLSPLDIFTLICLVIVKYPFQLLGLLPKLKPDVNGDEFQLPHLTLSAALAIDDSDVAAYKDATKTEAKQLLLLPGLINPLMLILMVNRNCPIMPFGAVNTKNRFEYLVPKACFSPSSGMKVTASFGGPDNLGRRVKRGIEFDIIFDVTHPEYGVILREVGTILSYLPSSTKPAFKPSQQQAEDIAWDATGNDILALEYNAPRTWAALCKDYNPIHMSSIMAKIFGFPGKIAHGNHALACALAQVQTAATQMNFAAPFALQVAFKRPMPLPLKMDLEYTIEKDDMKLRLVRAGKDHLTAETTLV